MKTRALLVALAAVALSGTGCASVYTHINKNRRQHVLRRAREERAEHAVPVQPDRRDRSASLRRRRDDLALIQVDSGAAIAIAAPAFSRSPHIHSTRNDATSLGFVPGPKPASKPSSSASL